MTLISEAFLKHAQTHFLLPDQLESFVEACQTPLRKSIRVNTLKVSVNEFLKLAENWKIQLSPIPWCKEGFWVDESSLLATNERPYAVVLGNLPAHLQGLFYIQEASSMLPPTALLPHMSSSDLETDELSCDSLEQNQAHIKILDLAAAPGSKTTQLAALTKNSGLILANEMSASRVKSLHANLVRCGVSNTCLSQFDGRKLTERLAGVFDYVLIDAPCGGEGTVRKDPKALQNWQLEKVQDIAELQKQLITTAYECLKPGGRLVYSTCTLSPEENQQVASFLLQTTNASKVDLGDLFDGASKATTKEGYLHVLPQIFDSEGFFVAAFKKPIESQISKYDGPVIKHKTDFQVLDKKTKIQLESYYIKHFGMDLNELDGVLRIRDKQVWLFPADFAKVREFVRLNRCGIKLAEIYPNKIRSSHEFMVAFANKISKQKLMVTLEQAESFYKGKVLELEQCEQAAPSEGGLNSQEVELHDGEVLVSYAGYVLGIGGLQKGKIKNLLPRDLVRDQIKFER